ncbi:cation diffusion facilitator family transporter [Methanofollis sp. W23]|uniref:cation diffusion facilitator family transporter n=1 Tax=Methanofollis sp. W23 TaxID=2817849 RepID=UPI001AE6E972|nr:cation diffusion facilitator family transporter [Methanofollis sp. W23]MBP2147028.1 cation diffusion facilitator family transporter [Methanofollis sp. W23]
MQYVRARRVLWLILIANITVALAKAVFGLLAGSMSMVADALHSTFDSVSNIIGIAAMTIAAIPPDQNHPYGHAKFETMGTLVVGGLLLLTAYWVITEGLTRITTGAVPEITLLTIGVMTATIVINILVARYERRAGKELGSSFLIADSKHTQSDILVSLSVLAGFGFVCLGYPLADPLIALAIGAIIGKMGLSILKDAGMILTDAATVNCEDAVKKAVTAITGVQGYHRFRCRGGAGDLRADIHVTVDPRMSVQTSHALTIEIEAAIIAAVPGMKEVIVHIEPGEEEDREVSPLS